MNRILVPTDFSEQAINALKVAAQMAKRFNGEIFLLHMLELPMQLVGTAASGSAIGGANHDLPEAIYFMKLAKKRFQDIMQEPYLKGINVHETVEFHQAFEGIMEVSEKYNCDIIIMGSHGATGFKEMFIGSNTEKVVRNSNIPVMVIKKHHQEFDVKDIAFATNCDTDYKHTLNQAIRFASLLEARLHLVYINTANNFKTSADAEKCLNDFVKGEEEKVDTLNIYNDVTIENGILNFAKSINANLIGISTHGRKGLAHFFNGSISEDLVNHAQQPVVTFKI
jgi:nucleotide-binding universal stress UspA family protein